MQRGRAGTDATAGPDFVFPAEVRNPLFRGFYDYWLSKRSLGRLPGRQHIDPVEMSDFLPLVLLLDVERQESLLRFRYRLIGTHVVTLFTHDVTGLYVDEVSSAAAYPAVYARLRSVVETGRPHYGLDALPQAVLRYRQYEHLTVPLAADGSTVDMLLGARSGMAVF